MFPTSMTDLRHMAPPNVLKPLVAIAALAVLAACGGGGGGAGSGANGGGDAGPSTSQKAVLGGTVATGAPLAGATLTVSDKTGAVVCTTQADAAGKYQCELPANAQAPLVIRAARDDVVLFSITASSGSATVNVTPLTQIIVSRLSPAGDPGQLAAAVQSGSVSLTPAMLDAQVMLLDAALKPLLDALGQSMNPISGAFNADGSGYDRVLDALSISVRPDGSGASIDITVRSLPGSDDSAPITIQFRSDAAELGTLPPLDAGKLLPSGISRQVSALLERMTSCYSAPLTQRVGTASDDQTAATGTAADVTGAACRDLFVNEDPASYLQGGLRVGRDASNAGAFASLFQPGSTGTRFDRGAVEYVRANGDVVLSYRSTSTGNGLAYATAVARLSGERLQLAGDGYAYDGNLRTFVADYDELHSPQFGSLRTGYQIAIAADSNVARVVATTPLLKEALEFLPNPATSFLGLNRNGVATTTPNLDLASAWKGAGISGPAGNPATSVTPQFSEAQIKALPDQAAWTLSYYDGTGQLLATQSYRTLSRPLSINEVKQQAVADFTPALRSAFASASQSMGVIQTQAAPANVLTVAGAAGEDGWTVPEAAVAPYGVNLFGSLPGVISNYNDATPVGPGQRKAVAGCVTHSVTDEHCDSAAPGKYLPGNQIGTVELAARSQRQMQILKQLGLRVRS